MSQIEYRKRLQSQRERAAARLAGFVPSPPQGEAAPMTLNEAAGGATPESILPGPVSLAAVVPVEQQPPMTPQQLREHAKATAVMLASMPQAEYDASLAAMQHSNPVLYGIVSDELNNLAAAAGRSPQDEDDGFDLTGLAGGQAVPPQGGAETAA